MEDETQRALGPPEVGDTRWIPILSPTGHATGCEIQLRYLPQSVVDGWAVLRKKLENEEIWRLSELRKVRGLTAKTTPECFPNERGVTLFETDESPLAGPRLYRQVVIDAIAGLRGLEQGPARELTSSAQIADALNDAHLLQLAATLAIEFQHPWAHQVFSRGSSRAGGTSSPSSAVTPTRGPDADTA